MYSIWRHNSIRNNDTQKRHICSRHTHKCRRTTTRNIRRRLQYSRIPVYDETIDDIKGILYIKDILKNINKKNIQNKKHHARSIFYTTNKNDRRLIQRATKTKKQMAIILDEYAGTAGLITMEDILEELVGEIYDEYDNEEAEYEKIDENTYMLSGSMPIYDVNKLLNAKIPEGDYDTLSGSCKTN